MPPPPGIMTVGVPRPSGNSRISSDNFNIDDKNLAIRYLLGYCDRLRIIFAHIECVPDPTHGGIGLTLVASHV